MKEVNVKTHPAYVSPEELDADIREMVVAQAGIIGALYHFPKPARDAFLGVDIPEDDWAPGFYAEWPDDRFWKDMPIEQHALTYTLRSARAYAFQEGDWPESGDLEDIWNEIAPISEQLPVRDVNGFVTGARRSLADGISLPQPGDPPETTVETGRLRRVINMFSARWNLDQGEWLSIAQLALLAGIAEETARTTISREGLQVVTVEMVGATHNLRAAEFNGLDNADAHAFLSRRRHFIPSRAPIRESLGEAATRLVLDGFGPFPGRLERLLAAREMTPAALAELAGTPMDWTEALVSGAPVEPRIEDIVRLARALDCATGRFAALAIEHLLS